ncbi:MAG: histidine triad protein [Firmicutes bacterium]|nr:histidine triad protein [Bacillota bacterium]
MCLTCNIIESNVMPVGGIIYKDDSVILHHCIDQDIPGYLIISPVRHVEAYGDLDQAEILRMGMIIKLSVAALKMIKGVDKVYVANFGEETAHFHMHIFPRYQWMLKYHAEDICTDSKVDGAKLFSFCRKQNKIKSDFKQEGEILAATEHVKTCIAAEGII